MNLPHLPPILFAKKVLEQNDNEVKVWCEFPYIPTLPMLLEAAAQASSALGKAEEGFLIGASEVKKLGNIEQTSVAITVKKEVQMQNMQMFSFLISNIAKGKFTIYVK